MRAAPLPLLSVARGRLGLRPGGAPHQGRSRPGQGAHAGRRPQGLLLAPDAPAARLRGGLRLLHRPGGLAQGHALRRPGGHGRPAARGRSRHRLPLLPRRRPHRHRQQLPLRLRWQAGLARRRAAPPPSPRSRSRPACSARRTTLGLEIALPVTRLPALPRRRARSSSISASPTRTRTAVGDKSTAALQLQGRGDDWRGAQAAGRVPQGPQAQARRGRHRPGVASRAAGWAGACSTTRPGWRRSSP